MSGYPKDITDAATAVLQQFRWTNEEEWFDFIAAAILAERERCVKVVREMLVYADTTSRSDEAITQRILKGGAA